MSLRRMMRQTLTVARRDFTATVMTPTFLLFLLAPLFMFGFGAIGGFGAAAVGGSTSDKERLYAVVAPALHARFAAQDRALRPLFTGEAEPPKLMLVAPEADSAAQARRLLAQDALDVPAVLHGPLEAPQLLHANPTSQGARYLAALDEAVLREVRAGVDAPLSRPSFTRVERASTSLGGKAGAALFAVIGLFLLTLMLASQVVGTMAEERTNKVIEVLAAAVPLESVFLGKLIGMFGVALLFLAFWGTIAANVVGVLPPDVAQRISGIAPAVGPMFPLLFVVYFTTAYLLLGAVFLGLGAQASTPREIQMLSLPITVFQMGMLGFSLAAAGQPGSWVASAAEIFPFSSPFAMVAHAANRAELWPHLAAIAWQLLWVSITIMLGARLFRRGVLQSAGPKLRLFGRAAAG